MKIAMKKGQKGPEVIALQQKLTALGYVLHNSTLSTGEFDGIFGADVARAIMQFVIDRRLIPVANKDGSLKPNATRTAIESIQLPQNILQKIESAKPWIRGIDVSHNQGKIDWGQVAADGVRFAWARATLYKTQKDKLFSTYWNQMAGIARGAYHVFSPTTSAATQLQLFQSTVGELSPGDLRPMLDVEGNHPVNGANDKLVECIEAWKTAYGVAPVIYSSKRVYRLWGYNAGAGCPVWLAYYVKADKPPVPAPWTDWNIWQTGYAGRKGLFSALHGITTDVDRNLLQGGDAELNALKL